jgi:DNA-binding NtrC family response regulator
MQFMQQYPWPGNIRQLKNVAEQVSVLEQFRLVEGEEVLRYLPPMVSRSQLPMVLPNGGAQEELNERDILYKVLFDMKKDLNELKKVVGHLVTQERLEDMPAAEQVYIQNLVAEGEESKSLSISPQFVSNAPNTDYRSRYDSQPDVEDIEENLSLEEVERQMITRALKKHQGRRKNAAIELGISERTLYRKIKEYDIDF